METIGQDMNMNRTILANDGNYAIRNFAFTVEGSDINQLVMESQRVIASQLPDGSYVVETETRPAEPEQWKHNGEGVQIIRWSQEYSIVAYVPLQPGEMPRGTYKVVKG